MQRTCQQEVSVSISHFLPVFQTKGTNSESKQNSGILRYESPVERGSLKSSSGGTTMAVSYFKASFSKTAP